MSIDHGKLLALCDVPGVPDQWDATDGYMHGWNDCLRALAQPAEAVEGADAFDHDAALAEWRRLEGHQPDAVRMRAAISASIPASINESAQDADDYWRDMYRIERAMRFMDGGMSREGAFTAVDKEMAHGVARGARRDAAQGDGDELRRLKEALAEYPLKNPQQMQARKVCAGVIKLAASYAEPQA